VLRAYGRSSIPRLIRAGELKSRFGLNTKAKLGALLLQMSAYGTKQTSISTLNMSAFGGKADMTPTLDDVR
jgi:hypothetical protein